MNTYKFIKHICGDRTSMGYLKNIPSSAIFYKIRQCDRTEIWWIAIPTSDFKKISNNWQGKNCHICKVVDLLEYTFIYISDIIACDWCSVSDIYFHNYFDEFFKSIYFYEKYVSREYYDISKDLMDKFINYSIKDIYKNTNIYKNNDTPDNYNWASEFDKIKDRSQFELTGYCFKMIGLTDTGDIRTIKLGFDERYGTDASMKHFILDGHWQRPMTTYDRRDNYMIISHNGLEYYDMFDECLNAIDIR